MSYWAIHINSDLWDIVFELLGNTTAKYRVDTNLISSGDKGIIWVTGKRAGKGIYSLIEFISGVTEQTFEKERIENFAVQSKRFQGLNNMVTVEFLNILNSPILYRDIQYNNILSDVEQFQNAHGLNSFPITNEQ